VNTGALLPDTGSGYFTDADSCTSGQPFELLMESRMREIRKSGSEGSGEETTGRKAGSGASPLTLRLRFFRCSSWPSQPRSEAPRLG
jgi:hypothetical protein